jgi:hypothetical protein
MEMSIEQFGEGFDLRWNFLSFKVVGLGEGK